MSIEVIPQGAPCGAEIRGVDVTRPLAPETVAAIEDAFLAHKVLLFRAQPMSARELAAFGAHFGELQPHVQKSYRHPEVPEVVRMTNRKPDGSFDEVGAARGAAERTRDGWHSDLSFETSPAKATLLHAVEVPSRGGNTCFANAAMLFRELPPELQQRLAGLRAEFPYGQNTKSRLTAVAARGLSEEDRARTIAVHPVVVAHPQTGEPAVYVSPYITSRILELPEEESDAILGRLFDRMDDPRYRWEHEWSAGDTLMWENRGGLMHSGRMDYPRGEARSFIRTTVRGGPLRAWERSHP